MAILDNLTPTGRKGVYYREHDTRRHGARKDRMLVIRYTIAGKTRTEAFGWTSAGATELDAERKIATFRANHKAGLGPVSLAEEQQAAQTERAAREAADKAQAEAERNRPTIALLWRKYTEANPGMKGIKQDRNRFEHYLRADFGDKTPAEITELDLERLRLGMLRGRIGPTKKGKTPKSAQTVKHVLVLLRRIIRYGVQHRLCPAPSLVFKMPKVDNQVTEHLTDDQVKSLVLALDQEEDRPVAALIKLAMLTGMRRGELLGLRWPNVDLDRALVRIDNPKGGKSQTIPISAAAVAVLREVADMRDKALHDAEELNRENIKPKVAQRIERAAKRADSTLVFPGKDGNPRHDLKRPLDRIRKKAGLPADFRPLHGLRHHFASTLASSGEVDLYTLQRLLTHKDPATTQRYAHLRDETLRSAADVAARAVAQAAQTKETEGESPSS